MINHTLDQSNSILYVRPTEALGKDDFEALAKTVDPFLSQQGSLAGVVFEAAKFPGWEGLGAMAAHFRFVREHHKRIKKVAIVTDSAMGNVAQNFASHFVAAEIKRFPAGQLEEAKQWVLKGG